MTTDRLTTAEAAGLADIKPASLRRARARGTFPAPDGYAGRSPYWLRSTVEHHLARPSRAGRPRLPDCPGTGKRWGTEAGRPVCPSCRRGPRVIRARAPELSGARYLGAVPSHVAGRALEPG